jgi:hypothetical protein
MGQRPDRSAPWVCGWWTGVQAALTAWRCCTLAQSRCCPVRRKRGCCNTHCHRYNVLRRQHSSPKLWLCGRNHATGIRCAGTWEHTRLLAAGKMGHSCRNRTGLAASCCYDCCCLTPDSSTARCEAGLLRALKLPAGSCPAHWPNR